MDIKFFINDSVKPFYVIKSVDENMLRFFGFDDSKEHIINDADVFYNIIKKCSIIDDALGNIYEKHMSFLRDRDDYTDEEFNNLISETEDDMSIECEKLTGSSCKYDTLMSIKDIFDDCDSSSAWYVCACCLDDREWWDMKNYVKVST